MSQTDSPLGTAPVGKLVLQLAIPAMLAQFVNILYSVVDRMYVGHIAGAGDAALAGVGVCAPVVTMITAIGALIGFGGGPLMSIRMGRRDMDGARQIITNSFYLLLALSVLATVPLLIFKRQILFTFGCSELLWDYAQAYFTTYVSGTVFALLSYGLNQITMSQGFSGTAMRSVMLGAAVNIALDPVFIFALHMGVRGAALATVLSQACSTVYILRFLFSGRAAVRITRQPVNFGWMRRIVQVGLSPALIIALDNVLLISINVMLRKYGGADSDMLIACAAIMQSFMLIITMPLGGITAGTQSILGYNYGAGENKRVSQIYQIVLCMNGIIMVLGTAICLLIPGQLMGLFTHTEATIQAGETALRIIGAGFIVSAVSVTSSGALEGLGKGTPSLLISLCRYVVVIIPAAFLLSKFFGAVGVWNAFWITEAITAIISLVIYRKAITGP